MSRRAARSEKQEMKRKIDHELRALLGPDCHMTPRDGPCPVNPSRGGPILCPFFVEQSLDGDHIGGAINWDADPEAVTPQQRAGPRAVPVERLELDTRHKSPRSVAIYYGDHSSGASSSGSSSSSSDKSSEDSGSSDSDEISVEKMFMDATATPRDMFSGKVNDAFDALFVNVDTCDLEKDDSADTSSSRLTELGESKEQGTVEEDRTRLEELEEESRMAERRARRAERKAKMAKKRAAAAANAATISAQSGLTPLGEISANLHSADVSCEQRVTNKEAAGHGRDSLPSSRPSSPVRAARMLEAMTDDIELEN